MNAHDLQETKHYLPTGLFLIVLGLIAIVAPAAVGTAVVVIIGIVLLGAGIAEAVQGVRADTWSSRLPSLLFGVITSACGLGVLGHPLLGLSFLTLLLAIYFVLGGIAKLVGSFCFRPISGWLLMLGSGLISLLLGVLIWSQWPVSGLWAVGVLVGVDLLVTGVAMVVLATTVRRIAGLATGSHAT
jgi:uncharacterized membrane protein HdeD (DUF308 family)